LRGKTSWFFANLVIKLLGILEDIARFIFSEEDDEKTIRKARVQTFLSYIIVVLCSSLIYWLTPFMIPRTHLGIEKLPGLTVKMLSFVWNTDRPDNTFPSQHASFSFLIFFIFNHLRSEPGFSKTEFTILGKTVIRKISVVGLIFLIWAILIVLSTFFVKQHIIADAFAGIALAYASYKIGFNDKLYVLINRIVNPVTAFFKKVFRLR
jgi:membrane-associated phospholipid phosphatase